MQTLEVMAKRFSARSYDSRSVPEDILHTVLNAGSAAAVAGGDYGAVHVTVVKSPEKMALLPAAPLYGAPVCVLLSAPSDPARYALNCANAGCILENMMLAATELGLGSVYLWGCIGGIAADEALCRTLGVPEGFTVISGLALGYTAEEKAPRELAMRFSCNEV